MSDRLLSTKEAAKRLGVCDRTVRRWIESGRIVATKSRGGTSKLHEGYVEWLRQEMAS